MITDTRPLVEINQQAIAGGYEGIMIKDPAAPYECKRTASWLKLKPFIEVSLNVTQLEEGTGRNVGRLGALVCRGSDDGRDHPKASRRARGPRARRAPRPGIHPR